MNRDNNNTLNIYKDEKAAVPISVVNRALEELTSRASASAQKQQKSNLNRLCDSLSQFNGKYQEVIQSMLESGISMREVFEVYLPDAARQLGNYWVQNTLSFAEVTLATCRLQTLARKLEYNYIGSINSGTCGPEIMIINPMGEQHTFGAQMISRQFRRLGASPYLSINNSFAEIKNIMIKHKFQLVGLSLSDYKLCNEQNEVGRIIEFVKKAKIPIVAGGSLTQTHKKKLQSLNLDMITNDAMTALRRFNIKLSKNLVTS